MVACLKKSVDNIGPDGSIDSARTSASITGDAGPGVIETLTGKLRHSKSLC